MKPCGAQWHPVDPETGAPWPTCRIANHRIKPATSSSGNRCTAACCGASSKSSLRHCTTKAISISQKRPSIGSFAPAKQGGARVGQDEAWQGVEDHGHRRSSGAPGRRSRGERHATRSHTGAGHTSHSGLSISCRCVYIGDNAYESDRLDAELARRGIRTNRHTGGLGHTGRKTVARCVAPTAVESRTTLCLVPELSADRRAL